jgi:polar amino acid transport system substrate-binding protein
MRCALLLVLFPLLPMLVLPGGCGGRDHASTLDRVLARGVLVVGTEPEFPPFESLDANGDPVGFDIDMARAIASDLGVDVRFEMMAFDSLPSALGVGKIDVILSGMTATPERAESRAFTDSYFRTQLCLLVGKDAAIHEPRDADGKRVVVKLGTTGDINATRLFPGAEITRFDTEGACALEVIHGRADAFLYDRHSILRHHLAHPDTTRALLEPLSDEPYAMAVRFGDQVFVDRLNTFLHDIRADGRYAAMYEKHFGVPPDDPR